MDQERLESKDTLQTCSFAVGLSIIVGSGLLEWVYKSVL